MDDCSVEFSTSATTGKGGLVRSDPYASIASGSAGGGGRRGVAEVGQLRQYGLFRSPQPCNRSQMFSGLLCRSSRGSIEWAS